MVIRIRDLTGSADTQEHGRALLDAMVRDIALNGTVVVSFDGIDIATSSFVNSSFVALLKHMSFDKLRAKVRVVDASKQINDMIRQRVIKESSVLAA